MLTENTTSDRKPSSAKTVLESISRTGIGVGHGMLAAPTTRAEGAVGWDLLLHQSVCDLCFCCLGPLQARERCVSAPLSQYKALPIGSRSVFFFSLLLRPVLHSSCDVR